MNLRQLILVCRIINLLPATYRDRLYADLFGIFGLYGE